MSIRVLGWSIDGFGIFHAETRTVSAGLSVFYGPNETGKSTLLAFLRGMLFGFPDRRSRGVNTYPPLRGGRHGGLLELEGPEGRFVIERTVSPNRETLVKLPDGRKGGEDDLRRILGGADTALYRSIFAFSLTELSDFENLTEEGVRDRILSAGIVGAGRPTSAALDRLHADMQILLNRRHEKNRGRIQEVVARLHEIELTEAAARREAENYPDCVAEEERLQAEIEEFQAAARRLSDERTHFETLVTLWPVWHDLEEAKRELDTLPHIEPETRNAVERLARELPAIRDLSLDLPASRRELVVMRESLDAALRDLGPDWNVERLSHFDLSQPRREEVRGWEEALEEREADLDGVRRKLETAEEGLRIAQEHGKAAVVARTSLPDSGEEPLDQETLDQQAVALRRLRERLNEYRTLVAGADAILAASKEKERSLRALETEQTWSPSPWTLTLPALLAAAFLISVIFEFLHAGFRPVVLIEGSLAVMFAAVAGVLLRHRWRAAARARLLNDEVRLLRQEYERTVETRDAAEVRMVTMRTRIAEDAVLLEVPALPSFRELEERDERLSRDRAKLIAWEQSDLAMRAAKQEIERAEGARRLVLEGFLRSEAGHAGEVREWEAWKSSRGIPAALSPRRVLEFFSLVERARAALAEMTKSAGALTASEDEVNDWAARARQAIVVTEESAIRAAPGASFDDLAASLVSLHDAMRRAGDLRREIERGESVLQRSLGEDERARGLRSELATGRLEAWREELAARDATLEDLDIERDGAVRRHDAARKRRQELERSADVARLQLERETLIAEIAAGVESWRELALAEALIEETRLRFAHTRRPAVLAEASHLFAIVTGGRYMRVDPGEDEDSIVVVDDRGERRETSELSRGTAEQLYLCVRLGYAADFAQRSVSLPLIMDDVLVNFDAERARATARVLVEFARDHQILFFTCHPHVREAFRESGSEVTLASLANHVTSGERAS